MPGSLHHLRIPHNALCHSDVFDHPLDLHDQQRASEPSLRVTTILQQKCPGLLEAAPLAEAAARVALRIAATGHPARCPGWPEGPPPQPQVGTDHQRPAKQWWRQQQPANPSQPPPSHSRRVSLCAYRSCLQCNAHPSGSLGPSQLQAHRGQDSLLPPPPSARAPRIRARQQLRT